MSDESSGGGLVAVAAAGIGGIYLVRMVQQMRYRAVNPDVKDPGAWYARVISAVPFVVCVVVAALAILMFRSTDPVLAMFGTVVCAVLGLVVAAVVALALLAAADHRRRAADYVITEAHYAGAPRQIKSNMRRIYRSARSLDGGTAEQKEILGDLGLERLVYNTAKRAVLSSELATASRDLKPDARPGDKALLEQANSQIKAIKAELEAVEQTLKRSAKTADALSRRLEYPDVVRASDRARAAAAEATEDRRQRARAKLEDATEKASAQIDFGHTDIEDRITAMSAGYAEAEAVSSAVLGGPKLESPTPKPTSDDDEPQNATAGDAVKRAAKTTAAKAAKLSGAAAKAGVHAGVRKWRGRKGE